MKKTLFFLFLGLVFITGCHWAAPPLDWENFDAAHIDQHLSDKGAWGDYHTVFWQNAKGYYRENDIAGYAISRGWVFAGSEKLDSTDMILFHKLYLTLVKSVFKQKEKPVPPWFKGKGTLYKFKFNYRKSNNGPVETAYSEILVSSDGSKMCAYPLLDDS